MKNSKFGLLSLMAILGIGAAYASKPTHLNGTTYYAVTNGIGGFNWTTVQPPASTFICQTATPYCTIVTIGGYSPVSNVVPTSLQATPISASHSEYVAR